MKAVNIIWDADNPEDTHGLPAEVDIPNNVAEDEVGDYISDVVGFCHRGFVLLK